MDGTTRRHMCVVYDLQVHRTFSFLKNGEVLQTGFIYLLFPLVSICGKAVLHDCLPRLETIYGFDSRGSSDVTRDATSDVIWRQNFPPIRALPKRQQPKRRTNEKVWGAQEKGVGGTGEGCQNILEKAIVTVDPSHMLLIRSDNVGTRYFNLVIAAV